MDMSDTNVLDAAPIAGARRLSLTTLLTWGAALALLALGFGLRLVDLTDQPLDFHPTRQLRSALVARGIYYQMLPNADPATRDLAIFFWKAVGQYEPPLLERIVALTYLALGKETLWVSRIYTSLFWVIGGLALFDLARRMAASGPLKDKPGWAAAVGLLSTGYYLFLPFAVQASRSFQPDPGMVMWIILSTYALYRWSEKPGWKWAILAGLFGGMAVLVKAVAAYMLFGIAAVLVLHTLGLKRSLRSPQVWTMAVMMIAPSFLYYLVENQGRAGQYFQTWTVELSHLLLTPTLYARWFNLLQDLMGLTLLLLGLAGVLIARPKNRLMLLGLWGGYLLYGLLLPYQMYSHNYYHLQVIPILALSLTPIFEAVLDPISRQPKFIQLLCVLIAFAGFAHPAYVSAAAMRADENRHEPAYWAEIASYLPTDGKIIGLTQDYGYRLWYYGWRKVNLWPNRGEQALRAMRGKEREFEAFFNKKIENQSYFLITAFGQLEDQPDLAAWLEEHYPVHARGGGYLIYDLQNPLP